MRIFVMFGTQDKRFDRLLNAILESNFIKNNDVYVQLGYTKGTYKGIQCQEYYTEEELKYQIKVADLIITHAGVGAIVSLKQKKITIVVPRLAKFKEQNNDHQVQILERFNKQKYIIPCTDLTKLDEVVNNAYKFKPVEYKTEKQGIIEEITDFINKIDK